MIDVCICTHNPRPDIFAKVLASIQNQTVGGAEFRFLVVDNASTPPLDESMLAQFAQNGIKARMVQEPRLGLARARLRAIRETDAEMLLFVDDDNELMSDYIAEGIKFASMHKDVGCFGGKLLLPSNMCPASWVVPFLPYLAIKDIGDEPVFGKSAAWGIWEPPGAGVFIKRPVLALYKQRADKDEKFFKLGRAGMENLSSCDDSLMMRGAFSLDLSNAYNPKLVLYHHLDAKRFNLKYLIRLMYAYGVSRRVLESMLNGPQSIPEHCSSKMKLLRMLLIEFVGGSRKSLALGIGFAAVVLGERNEYLRQCKVKE